MSPSEILKSVRAQPFEPLRIHLSDGSSYDVPHPEFIFVSRKAVFIAMAPDADDVPEKVARCDPFHITRIEPLAPSDRSRG